jgi:uncharacterized membrane protein YbhN (UPF0104 family)
MARRVRYDRHISPASRRQRPRTVPRRLLANRRLLPLQLVLWLAPLAGVAWWASKQPAPTVPTGAGALGALAGALALYALATVARAERWERILRASGISVTRADTYALVPVGYMGNNVLPARGGEMLRTFLLGSSAQASRRTVLGTILAERLLDAIALGLILVVLAYGLLQRLATPSTGVLLAVGAALLAVALLIALAATRERERFARLVRALKPLIAPCRTLLGPRGVALLGVSLVIWSIEAAVYIVIGEAVNVHLGLQGGLSVVAFTNAAALIPAAPGYVGTYDAAVLFAVKAVTGASVGAVSYLVLLRFVLFVPITVVGFILLLVRYGGFSRVRAARAESRLAEATA